MSARKADPGQLDFFRQPTFPSRTAAHSIDIERFRARLKRAMARAIRECPHDRETIAERMALYLGLPSISRGMLDAYTAESKTGHDITLVRFAAFVHATGAIWLWDEAMADQGATLLIGDEARLAEIALLQQEQERIKALLRDLKARPVKLSRGR
ncbi:hypothetical protein SAMN05880590_102777 [Rhizobium sp. RU35A]|uniref:hypothetical protein n=1 Tax=Rhizobium sp. RU35A TaxID=1907414 RepID=UPI00095686F4|nr:hypothetical protein [Rhizobium sp. RU35A]SIQ24661.1 hypothetical protein SAMN05880590_102777 [Rhizobium sp. RU35A]